MTKYRIILLGVDTPIGLALIRELAAKKVEVIGIGHNQHSIGRYSNQLDSFYIRNPDKSELAQQILYISKKHNVDQLLAISENDIEILNGFKKMLRNINILTPSQKMMDLVLNKDVTYQYAEQLNIPCPKNYTIEKFNDLDKIHDIISFPVILKWANPQSIIKDLYKNGLSFEKIQYAYDYNQLKSQLSKYKELNSFPLIQSYCGGVGIGHFFFIHNAKVIQRFQHERLHEWPPEGGTSTQCKAIPLNKNKELLKKSEQLLLALKWEGVAMVEYRLNKKTGEAFLMEINGRFWGSYPLAQKAGAEFGWLLYSYKGINKPSVAPLPNTTIIGRFMFPEIRRLFRVLFQPSKIIDEQYINTPMTDLVKFFGYFLNPNSCYFVFSIYDPKPFIFDVFNAIRKVFNTK